MSNTDDDYKVGYCKPPKDKQFPKGKSGNPKGRPKSFFHKKFADVQHEMVTLKLKSGETVEMSYQEMIIRKLVTEAASGKQSAIKNYIELMKHLSHVAPV